MGVEKEASVRVKLSGDDEIASQTAKMGSAWGEVGSKAAGAFKTMGGAVGSAVQGVLSDLGHVVSAAGAISFSGSVLSVEKFEESVARLGVASGRSIGSVQSGINALAQEIGELPAQTEAWVHSVGDLTYSYERAAASAKGLQGFALQTGQSLGSVAPLAAILDQVGAGGEKAGRALDVMTQQAEMLGTVGGPKALGDMLTHLSGQITNMASGEGPAKITALMAGFGGNKGFTPQQRERALGGVLGRVEGNVEGFERFIGKGKLTDEFGHMKDTTSVMEELQKYGKKGKGQAFRLEQTFGREATAAIMHSDFAAIRDAEKALGGGAGGHALDRFKDTPAGKRHEQETKKDIAMQGAVGSDSLLGGIRRKIGDWSADSPLATMAGMMVGGKLASAGLGAGIKAIGLGGGAAATGGGAAATGGTTAVATGLGGGLALGAGVGLAGLAASFAVLAQVGEGSAMKQGFMNKALTPEEAASKAAATKAANDKAFGNMSPGMRAAAEAEQALKQKTIDARNAQAGGAASSSSKSTGPDPKMTAMVAELVKAGASLQLAQETAAQMMAAGQQPIQIEIINPTGADIEARPRGRQ